MNKAIVVLFLLICSVSVFPEEVTVDQLKKKIEQLENRVTILEKIIADQNNKKVKSVNAIPSDKQIWRKLRKGMNQDDVRKLLGEPLTINGGSITYWYFSKSISNCYVMFIFDNDDNIETVYGWTEPE